MWLNKNQSFFLMSNIGFRMEKRRIMDDRFESVFVVGGRINFHATSFPHTYRKAEE